MSELEPENLEFWSQGIDEQLTDFQPFTDHIPAMFSPTPSEYGSLLESMEMELRASNPTLTFGEEKKGNDEGGGEEEGSWETAGCKNLQSERNRRRRLNQQLLALRSLVPCISKMDKRSILMDAAAYLQSIHREIDQITREIPTQESSDGPATSLESHLSLQENSHESSSSVHHQILQIDTEELHERTFAVKVTFRRAPGAPLQVQRLLESLGFYISQTWTHVYDQHRMITTTFMRVKDAKVAAETLKTLLNKAAVKFGTEVDMIY